MVTEISENPKSVLKRASKPVFGVVHLLPLPGSSGWQGQVEQVLARAEQEATALASAGVDGILIENYYDAPYRNDRVDVAAAILIAQATQRIQHFVDGPLGVSIRQNDPETALAIAMATGADFIRVPVLVGTMVREEGMVSGKLNELCDYRKALQGCGSIQIYADVTMNHIVPAPQGQRPWKAPLGYLENVVAAIKKHNVADALIVSERDVTPDDVAVLREKADMPVFVGDRFTEASIKTFYEPADGLFLAEGIQKSPLEGQTLPAAVDMAKIESLIQHLDSRGVTCLSAYRGTTRA